MSLQDAQAQRDIIHQSLVRLPHGGRPRCTEPHKAVSSNTFIERACDEAALNSILADDHDDAGPGRLQIFVVCAHRAQLRLGGGWDWAELDPGRHGLHANLLSGH
eukprot:2128013-Prymnesium_polylepis.2